MSVRHSAPPPPDGPGVRRGRHPPDRLHSWVFLQRQVWVDYRGDEHEIDSMSGEYARAVITFCERCAQRIMLMHALDLLAESFEVLVLGVCRCHLVHLRQYAPRVDETAEDWLQGTPLLDALKHRARTRGHAPGAPRPRLMPGPAGGGGDVPNRESCHSWHGSRRSDLRAGPTSTS